MTGNVCSAFKTGSLEGCTYENKSRSLLWPYFEIGRDLVLVFDTGTCIDLYRVKGLSFYDRYMY